MDIKNSGKFIFLTIGLFFAVSNTYPPSVAWDGAKVHVFDSYIIDLNYMQEQWIPGRIVPVQNCSDETFFCLKSDSYGIGIANFVLPKKCLPIKVGQSWSKNGVTTSVIWEKSEENTIKYGKTYLIYTDSKPNNIFVYRPLSGIVSIYKGSDGLVDAVKNIGQDLKQMEKSRYLVTIWFRKTFDNFAACKEK